jgi:hypothetical protein
MPTASDVFEEARSFALAPADKLGFLDWCQKEVRLPDDGPDPGRFRLSDKFALMRGVYDYVDEPSYTEGVLVKIPQVGGSTWLLNLTQYRAVKVGKNTQYYTSTDDKATETMRREVIPRFRACEATNRLISPGPDSVTNNRIEMLNGTLFVLGGRSAASAGSTPAVTVNIDESDKIKAASKEEAHVGELAAARTKRFPYTKKLNYISTPTIKAGYIWQKYSDRAASRGHWKMKCPHCGAWQELVFDGSKRLRCDNPKDENGDYDLEKVMRETYYVCVRGCKIAQKYKRRMVAGGRWEHENPKAKIRSWHISGFMSPDYNWGDMLAAFFRFKSQPGGLQKFYNEFLGLPYDAPAIATEEKDIAALVNPAFRYKRGELPFEPARIGIYADTQDAAKGFWFAILAWDYKQNVAVVDWGQAAGFGDLEILAQRLYGWGGEQYMLTTGIIDLGGNRTSDVYDFALANLGFWYPAQGRSPKTGLYTPVALRTREWKDEQLCFIQFLDDMFKQELYYKKIKLHSGPALLLPYDYAEKDNSLNEQLTNEVRYQKKDGSYAWGDRAHPERDATNNHLGDCIKEGLVSGNMMSSQIESERLERIAAAKKALTGGKST